MNRLMLTAVLFLTACPGPDPVGPGENEEPITPSFNGDFEDLSTVNNDFTGWIAHEIGYTIFRSNDVSTGKTAVRFSRPATAPDDGYIRLGTGRFRVTPGIGYTFSAVVRGASPGMRIEVRWYDDLNQCIKDGTGACLTSALPVTTSSIYTAFSTRVESPVVAAPRTAYADVRVTVLDEKARRDSGIPSAVIPRGAEVFLDDMRLVPAK